MIDHFNAFAIMVSDYYPFGMQIPGRSYNTGLYRYGFNGQEHDDEVKGNGNSYGAEFWEYDPRIGRRWNLDPETTIGVSPYASLGNNPTLLSDPHGDTIINGQKYEPTDFAHATTLPKVEVFARRKWKDTDEVSKTSMTREQFNKISFSNRDYFASETQNKFGYNIVKGIYSPSQEELVLERTNDFLSGTGFTNQVYTGSTYFTWEILKHYRINEAREAFYAKYKNIVNSENGASKFKQLAANNQILLTRFDTKWSLSDIPKTSGAMQFVGTAKVSIFSSKDAQRLIFVVANSTSRTSLYYHLDNIYSGFIKNRSRVSEVGGSPESTINNLSIWTEDLNYGKFKK